MSELDRVQALLDWMTDDDADDSDRDEWIWRRAYQIACEAAASREASDAEAARQRGEAVAFGEHVRLVVMMRLAASPEAAAYMAAQRLRVTGHVIDDVTGAITAAGPSIWPDATDTRADGTTQPRDWPRYAARVAARAWGGWQGAPPRWMSRQRADWRRYEQAAQARAQAEQDHMPGR